MHLMLPSYPFTSFGPILFKQVPYTMAKFAVYEVAFVRDRFYLTYAAKLMCLQEKMIAASGKPKSELSAGTISTLNLASGLVAGFAAAIISQPADTLLSKINKTKALPGETVTSRLIKFTGQLGVGGLFTGMGARYVH